MHIDMIERNSENIHTVGLDGRRKWAVIFILFHVLLAFIVLSFLTMFLLFFPLKHRLYDEKNLFLLFTAPR